RNVTGVQTCALPIWQRTHLPVEVAATDEHEVQVGLCRAGCAANDERTSNVGAKEEAQVVGLSYVPRQGVRRHGAAEPAAPDRLAQGIPPPPGRAVQVGQD